MVYFRNIFFLTDWNVFSAELFDILEDLPFIVAKIMLIEEWTYCRTPHTKGSVSVIAENYQN